MRDSEVIEEIAGLLTDEADGDVRPCAELGDGWAIVGELLAGEGSPNSWFEIVTPDGSVHHVFSVRVR